jgi:phage anti-repressor protein
VKFREGQIERVRLLENRDFVVLAQKGVNPKGGRPSLEYHLTLDAGKHVAMMSGTDKGFEVRDYFIACEKVAKSKVNSYSSLTASIPTSQTDTVTAIMSLGKMVGETPLIQMM